MRVGEPIRPGPASPSTRRTPLRTGLSLSREALSSPEARQEILAAFDRRLLKPLPRLRRRIYGLFGLRPRGPLLRVPGGTLLPPEQAKHLPVVMLVLVGAGDRIEEWVDRVAQTQVESAGFRPLFVVDAPHFAKLRQYGFLFEYLMPYADWSSLEQPADWARYVQARLNRLTNLYRPSTVIVLPEDPHARNDSEAQSPSLLATLASLTVRR